MGSQIKKPVNRQRKESSAASAILRLAGAGRTEEVMTALLEAAAAMGFPRGLIAELNLETLQFGPVAELNWPGQRLNALRGSLSGKRHELASTLRSLKPVVLASSHLHDRPLYLHPLAFSAGSICEQANEQCCFVPRTVPAKRGLAQQTQTCVSCGIRGYVFLLIIELPPAFARKPVNDLADLAHAANRQLSRLHWIRHMRAGVPGAAANRPAAPAPFTRDEAGASSFRWMVENLGDPIVVCDSEGEIIWSETQAAGLFTASAELGVAVAQAQNRDQLAGHLTALLQSQALRRSARLRLYDPAAHTEVDYEARSMKVSREDGGVSFAVTILRDLSGLPLAEQPRLERNLLEIEKFAATGRLAATIAHEVNNPMDAIKNSIYFLSAWVPEKAMPYFNILKSETERVSRIVRQMLGLYRNTEQVRPINLNTIVTDTMMLFGRQLQHSDIKVKEEFEELPDTVIAADQISQVLSNLVLNARDAMAEGGRLRVRTRFIAPTSDSPHGWVRVVVADTGTGIPKELLPSIFDPFITTKGERGTGLGLWIVKGIVQSHAGRLSLKSRLGQGTVFKIDLPVLKP